MTFLEILEHIKSESNPSADSYLIAIINETGIHSKNNENYVTGKIQDLTLLLNSRPDYAQAFRTYLINLYSSYDSFTLYTDAGILPGHGFFAEAYKRLKYKILPPLQNASHTQYLIRKIFCKSNDNIRIANIEEAIWLKLFDAINIDIDVVNWKQQNLNYLLNALMVLSQRITAIGLEPEVVDKLPEIDDLQSPFFGLYREVEHYVDSFKLDIAYVHSNEMDYQQILVMCTQCKESISELHKHKERIGISIHLAYLMLRLEQHVLRLSTILKLIQSKEKSTFNETILGFMSEVVYAENKKYSVKKHLNDNLSLIAYKITENSSRIGEHYRAATRGEYFSLFKSAMGGGLIVALIVLLKIYAHHFNLPPFGEAFMNSLVYSLGFITIHFLHFTLATKQPAMTANTIAASIDQSEKKDKQMLSTVRLIAEISRAQIISLVGNIIIVLPASYFIGMAYLYVNGYNIISATEAHEMIMSLHPWFTGSLFYAGITGVLLMSSGIVAGFYDNKVVYGRIPERIEQHPFLNKIFSPKSLKKISEYMELNTGIIMGNIFLGIFLGAAPMLGKFFGLPIEVRHVTLSTGNLGLALQSSEHYLPLHLLIEVSASILLIGFINLFVSFGLSIYVAVRSRSLHVSRMRSVLNAINLYFRKKPIEFFIPPGKHTNE